MSGHFPQMGLHGGPGALPPDVAGRIADYDRMLRDMRGRLDEVTRKLESVKTPGENTLAPRFIEDIPGKRVPYWWVLTIPVNSAISNGAQWSGAVTLSQDGPLVINSTRAFWQITTSSSNAGADTVNAFVPVTRYNYFNGPVTGAPNINRDIIDWAFSISIAGGGRNWQNSNIPGALFATAANRPEYYGMPGWVERNDTMTIQAVAQVSATAGNAPDSSCRGTLYFVHTGYKILRPIDYAEAFGMSP